LAGERLSKPKRCHKQIYELMLKCWARTLKDRPRFHEIYTNLQTVCIHTQCHCVYIQHTQCYNVIVCTYNIHSVTMSLCVHTTYTVPQCHCVYIQHTQCYNVIVCTYNIHSVTMPLCVHTTYTVSQCHCAYIHSVTMLTLSQ